MASDLSVDRFWPDPVQIELGGLFLDVYKRQAGMFDVDACGIASGLVNENHICMIAGTWSINEFISKKPIIDGSVALNSMFCIPGYFLIEESSPTSAGNMEWFIHNLMGYEKKEAEEQGDSVLSLIHI